MARTVTLTQLIGWVRSKSDQPSGTAFVTDAEITDEVNAGIAALHRKIASTPMGYEYFRAATALTTAPNVDTVALPADFFKLLHLWWNQGNNVMVPLARYMPVEGEAIWPTSGWTSGPFVDQVRYSLTLDGIRFVPTPAAVHTLKLEYIRAPARLVAGSDTWEGYAGFEEFPQWYAVALILQKEESDASVALARMQSLEADIMAAAARDQAGPIRSQDLKGWPGSRRLSARYR